MSQNLSTFYTASSIAARAQVHRSVLTRLVMQAKISPDAYLVAGDATQPIFREERALDILRGAARPRRRNTALPVGDGAGETNL
jgi:hypothetical protein